MSARPHAGQSHPSWIGPSKLLDITVRHRAVPAPLERVINNIPGEIHQFLVAASTVGRPSCSLAGFGTWRACRASLKRSGERLTLNSLAAYSPSALSASAASASTAISPAAMRWAVRRYAWLM